MFGDEEDEAGEIDGGHQYGEIRQNRLEIRLYASQLTTSASAYPPRIMGINRIKQVISAGKCMP